MNRCPSPEPRPYPHRLDLRPLGAVPAQPRDVRDLHAPDHLAAVVGDREHVARISRDVRESPLVPLIHDRHVTARAELVVDEHGENGG
jgi:hypothetical protein